MKKKTVILVLMLSAVQLVGRAQSLDAFRQQLAEPQPTATLFGRAQVTVTENGDAARAIADASRASQRQRVRGYRVCIFFDNGQNARAGAVAARNLFEESFPGEKVQMVYENPYFKVTIGNCLTAEEAIILKGRVSAAFPKAFLKSEDLALSDFLN